MKDNDTLSYKFFKTISMNHTIIDIKF